MAQLDAPRPTSELDRALDEGSGTPLPPNHPKGILGEKGFDLYKVDTFEPDLNAGVSQENDGPVIVLGLILAYLLCFPLAFWLLWRSTLYTRRQKLVVSACMAAGIIAFAAFLALG